MKLLNRKSMLKDEVIDGKFDDIWNDINEMCMGCQRLCKQRKYAKIISCRLYRKHEQGGE